MGKYTITEQVEALIKWAQGEADRTGHRQKVEAVKFSQGWYYQVRETLRSSRVRRSA